MDDVTDTNITETTQPSCADTVAYEPHVRNSLTVRMTLSRSHSLLVCKFPGAAQLCAATQQTILDAFSQSRSSRRREQTENRSDTMLDSDTGAAQPRRRFSILPRPGNRWQWSSRAKPMLLSQFADSPVAALARFLRKHGTSLQSHSIASPREAWEEDLDTMLESISLPPAMSEQLRPAMEAQGPDTGGDKSGITQLTH
eukprot:673930-Amphidinium_carterae.3